jgi:hypothetical protein
MPLKRSPGAPASAARTRSNSNRGGFSALGTHEQEGVQAIDLGDRVPPPRRLAVRSFPPLPKGTLRGFASVELPRELEPVDCP